MSLDQTSVLLNVATYVAGWVSCHLLFPREPRGARMSEPKHRREPLHRGWDGLVLGIVLLLVGAQQYQYQSDKDAADKAQAAEARSDALKIARQTACVSRWGAEVVATIETRTDANTRLEAAQTARDDAADRLFLITDQARRIPPRATVNDFNRALHALVRTVRNLDEVKTETEKTRTDNPYPPPPTLICPAED